MSTLTKILVILLTISSIFVCAMVVTYVASADNYRKQNESLRTKLDAEVEKRKSAQKQLDEEKSTYQQQETKLTNEIASLSTEMTELDGKLSDAEREKASLLQQVESWTSITRDFYVTNEKQGQLLKDTLNELKRVQAEQIKQKKDLNETSSSLLEKMAIIETLEGENKRLVEEKTELRSRLDQMLQPIGKIPSAPVPVTPRKEIARLQPALPPVVEDIGLKGLIRAVDVKNKMAGISIGTADGVREGMRFHVVRGDEFICDILILHVETEEAVGILELVEQPPKVGDIVTTDFSL